MQALILDGRKLSIQLEEQLLIRVAKIKEKHPDVQPTLATILVGSDPASATYVQMKINACKRIGLLSKQITLTDTTTTDELLDAIENLNQDPQIFGILLQHPVPAQIDERKCFDAIALEKDVDGVTCHGFGRMAMGANAYGSATPAGIMRLLDSYNIDIAGKHAVVVGRSPILGKPIAMMLLGRNASVTICHSYTENLSEIVSTADIVIGAVGKPEFIKGDCIKDNAIVVDAGYHPDGKIGDIELSSIKDRCAAYTPVPGGVGPMTIATLLEQTVQAVEKQFSTAWIQ